MVAEGKNLVGGDDVLAVGQDEELQCLGLLFAGLVADVDDDFADALDLRLQDGLDLPHAVLVVTPALLQKFVDGFFGGRGSGEVRGIRLGKCGRSLRERDRRAAARARARLALGHCCGAGGPAAGRRSGRAGNTRKASAAAPAKRRNGRVKRFLLVTHASGLQSRCRSRDVRLAGSQACSAASLPGSTLSRFSHYHSGMGTNASPSARLTSRSARLHLDLDGDGKTAAHAKRLWT